MPWIEVIDETEADGELKSIYEKVSGKRGKVSNIMRIQSLNPKAMQAHLDLYLSLMFEDSGLTREQRELIGTAVSAANDCGYCITHHALALNHYWKDDERVQGFIGNYHTFKLPENERAMLDYAIKLTQTPASVTREDVETLRRYGFADEDILSINMITGYFNFVNRIVLGLGVEFTQEEAEGYKY